MLWRDRKKIEKAILNCDSDTCIVDLHQIIGIKWDEWYCFDEYSNSESISPRINIDYKSPTVPDSHVRVILLREGKIVHEEGISRNSTPHVQFLRKNWRDDPVVYYSEQDSTWFIFREREVHTGKIFYNIIPVGYTR